MVPEAERTEAALTNRELVKTGGRLIQPESCYWLLLAEGHLTRRLFGAMKRDWRRTLPPRHNLPLQKLNHQPL
jgi:hypothetical protein